jgi:hypothetical protein
MGVGISLLSLIASVVLLLGPQQVKQGNDPYALPNAQRHG